jgi:diadenylate cyclase
MLDSVLQIGMSDIVQILILYIAIYAFVRYIKGTRSAQMLLGFAFLVVMLLSVSWILHFDVISRVVYFILGYLAIGVIVVFQHEIRRFLASLGGQSFFFTRSAHPVRDSLVHEILCKTVLAFSRQKIGALIAVERGISLAGYEESGVRLNAITSKELLVSIFTPPLPLHDGGVVVRNGLIASAHCLFPLSSQPDLDLGMRHRSALGLSEETDAVVLIVSEETGQISIAYNGHLHQYPADSQLEKMIVRWLRVAMPNSRPQHRSLLEWFAYEISTQWQHFRTRIEEAAGDHK